MQAFSSRKLHCKTGCSSRPFANQVCDSDISDASDLKTETVRVDMSETDRITGTDQHPDYYRSETEVFSLPFSDNMDSLSLLRIRWSG